MPEPLPSGEVLEDNAKRRWKLGAPIGKGGFGEIYGASEEGDRKSQYVVKIVSPFKLTSLFVNVEVRRVLTLTVAGASREWPVVRGNALLYAERKRGRR